MKSETRHAVITGGTGSLGIAIAAALQAPDWTIAVPGSVELDVRDAGTVREYFHDRDVDLLVCAAGMTRDAPIARLTYEAWDDTWSVNFRGAADCANAVLPGMTARRSGHIVFISSHSALHPPAGQAAYAAAKAALLGLVADLASRHGPSNIRVNAVLPGFLETRMTRSVTEARRHEILTAHSLGRLNTCDRVAAFIRFLHHELSHTSGQVFQLDSR
jgi:3-oxoacyl-[acyl-carrier protein] reductase